jgi:hypothetical protein
MMSKGKRIFSHAPVIIWQRILTIAVFLAPGILDAGLVPTSPDVATEPLGDTISKIILCACAHNVVVPALERCRASSGANFIRQSDVSQRPMNARCHERVYVFWTSNVGCQGLHASIADIFVLELSSVIESERGIGTKAQAQHSDETIDGNHCRPLMVS